MNGEGDPDAPITYRGLEAVLTKHLDKTIKALRSTLEGATKIANDALILIKKLEKEIAGLKEENIKLRKNLTNETNNIKQNENKIEDRTNHQLLKTLVFHNIPELESETWDQTEKLVAEAIADVCNIEVKEAAENLERVHRSAPNPRYKGTAHGKSSPRYTTGSSVNVVKVNLTINKDNLRADVWLPDTSTTRSCNERKETFEGK